MTIKLNVARFGMKSSGVPSSTQFRRALYRPLSLRLRITTWLIIVTQLLAPIQGSLLAATEYHSEAVPALPAADPWAHQKPTQTRTTPFLKQPSLMPEFSERPADIEFFHAHVFSMPLRPLGHTTVSENRDLAHALMAFLKRGKPDDVSSLTSFVDGHPASPWDAPVLYNIGKIYRSSGHISKALATWEQTWPMVESDTSEPGKIIADATMGELAELYGRLGRMESVEKMIAQASGRGLAGTAVTKLYAVREGFWTMQHRPEVGFLCGPMALASVLEARGEKGFPSVLKKAHSTTNGTSLAQLKEWSDQMNMHLQMAKREKGASMPVPSVVHWKSGHFAALIKEEGDKFLMKDPVFEQQIWMTKEAFDDESSGYCLIPEGALSNGWHLIDEKEGATIWGKGSANTGPPNFQRPYDPKVKPCPTAQNGMAQYNINAMLPALTLFDTPVGYKPPRGPQIAFTATYDQFDVSDFGVTPAIGNLGPNFNYNYLSYLIFDTNSPYTTMNLFVRGGGKESYGGFDITSYNFAMQEDSKAILHQNDTNDYNSFTRTMPDGSLEIFDLPMAMTSSQVLFLTKIVDPMGNTNTLTYDSYYRLTYITDAIGQTTTNLYASTNSSDPIWFYKFSQVSDPFGRSAYFTYYTNYPYQLAQITDVIGINSQFTYTNTNYISALTTPYGTTTFAYGGATNTGFMSIKATDPEGNSELAMFVGTNSDIPTNEIAPTNIVDGEGDGSLEFRNTFYWDKNAMQQAPGDVTRAKIFHWLHLYVADLSHMLESEKAPLESRVWYRYPGQDSGEHYEQDITNGSPSTVSRILDDGSTQLYQYEYNNAFGKVTKATDPLGRTTIYTYAVNGLDLTQVQQVNGTNNDILSTMTYNSQHLPLTIVDASGQTNFLGYNSYGQLTAVTNALGQTLNLYYDINGYLTNMLGSLPGATNSFTYDNVGRVQTSTDSSGYTLTFAYDNLDRLTRITHPDGTYEQVVYQWLDPVLTRDRRGHWTSTTYDSLRRVRDIRDSLNRVTHFEWCGCGSLATITDPLGNTTTWLRDVEGRPTTKLFPDQTTIQYGYGLSSGRLTSVTDAKNQTKLYSYFPDNNLQQVTYSNAVVSTPNVSYAYDTVYNRMLTMTDGTGTTAYTYNPITVPPALGAGRLAAVTNSALLGNAVVTYRYDALGRVTNRAIGGAGVNMTFDALGRATIVTNILGKFTNTYVGATMRLSSVAYPNGQGASFSYFDTNHDLRLQTLLNTNASGGTISRFDYTYDADGQIQTWTKQADTTSTNTFTFTYDPVDQLLGAVLAQTGAPTNILHQYLYSYDPSGNRTGEQVDAAPVGATYNSLNQLTSQITNGLVQFSGNISKTGAVTVAAIPAAMTNQTNFSRYVALPGQTNQIQISATDLNGNNTVSNYQLIVTNTSVVRTLIYDLNGNLVTNAAPNVTNTYEWDAENRLTAINEGTTNRSEFTYDGSGRRVKIVEKTNGVAYSTKTFLWCGTALCEERDSTGANVTKRFFGQGEQISGTNYYFTKDHLGSIHEMTDASGTIHARYDYDPYGRMTKVSGEMDADFGFTGHYRHVNSGLFLTLFRAYDPNTGRWISRDPIAEEGGINLYAYALNNTLNFVDPLGQISWATGLIGGIGLVVAVAAITLASPVVAAVVVGAAVGAVAAGVTADVQGLNGSRYAETVGIGAIAGAISSIPGLSIPASLALGATTSAGANVANQLVSGKGIDCIDWGSVGRSAIAGGIGAGTGSALSGYKVPPAFRPFTDRPSGGSFFTSFGQGIVSATAAGTVGGYADATLNSDESY